MKKKKIFISYFILALFLFLLLNLPKSVSTALSRQAFIPRVFATAMPLGKGEEFELKLENRVLKDELDYLKNWIFSEGRIEEILHKMEEYPKESGFYKRRIRDLSHILEKEIKAIPAKVIFHSPRLWESGFWIDKGEEENQRLQELVLQKNSPVLSGGALVGVVEVVEAKRAYVRLITDSDLHVAVRAVRGIAQNERIGEILASFKEELKIRDDLLQRSELLPLLSELESTLKSEGGYAYLAKGELSGSSRSLWRSRASILKGIGFNYEFSDEEGDAKGIHEKEGHDILHVGDLLITSGLDGIFPEGIPVGSVLKIYPLKEGGYSFDIEAITAIPSLHRLSYVTIYPPL